MRTPLNFFAMNLWFPFNFISKLCFYLHLFWWCLYEIDRVSSKGYDAYTRKVVDIESLRISLDSLQPGQAAIFETSNSKDDGPRRLHPTILDLKKKTPSYESFGPKLFEDEREEDVTLKSTVTDTIDSVSSIIKVDISKILPHQEIIGFGGAFTDATILTMTYLSKSDQQDILSLYFDQPSLSSGLKEFTKNVEESTLSTSSGSIASYTLGRLVLGSCDFSPYVYDYAPVPNDMLLENFTLAEDLSIIGSLPFVANVLSNYNPELKLFASPWSAPAWMKDSTSQVGGEIKGYPGDDLGYYKTWALYISKYLKMYNKYFNTFLQNSAPSKSAIKLGMEDEKPFIWGLTVQNEPTKHNSWQTQSLNSTTEYDFIVKELIPILDSTNDLSSPSFFSSSQVSQSSRGSPYVNIFLLDDSRRLMTSWASDFTKYLDNESPTQKDLISSYVKGVGFHWYNEVEDLSPRGFKDIDDCHTKFPDLILIGTEACNGYIPGVSGPRLGYWRYGEIYGYDVLNDIKAGASGWNDWNLVLDKQGGPNWASNYVDAPIITDFIVEGNKSYLNQSDEKNFYLQPMFYYLTHFSRFLRPGYRQIQHQTLKVSSNKKTEPIISSVEKSLLPLEIDVLTMIGYNRERSLMKEETVANKEKDPFEKASELYNEVIIIVLNRKNWGGFCEIKVLNPDSPGAISSIPLTIKAHSIQTVVVPI